MLSIDLVRRPVEGGFEFATIMWLDDLDSVKAFVGDDYEVARVPERAREVLSRFDQHSAHYEVIDRSDQRTDGGRAPQRPMTPPHSVPVAVAERSAIRL